MYALLAFDGVLEEVLPVPTGVSQAFPGCAEPSAIHMIDVRAVGGGHLPLTSSTAGRFQR